MVYWFATQVNMATADSLPYTGVVGTCPQTNGVMKKLYGWNNITQYDSTALLTAV